jgi:hypothetical protein
MRATRFPPPMRGRDREGVATSHRARSYSARRFWEIRNLGAAFVRHGIGNNRCAGCTPLPVPPPHGGRERCGTALPKRRPAFAQVHGGPRALQHAHLGLMPIASSWELYAPSQDSRPNARIPASSKDMLLVRPSSKLCGTTFCSPRRADSTQLCALSRCTSSPSPLWSDVRFEFAPSSALIVVSQDGLFFFHRSRR